MSNPHQGFHVPPFIFGLHKDCGQNLCLSVLGRSGGPPTKLRLSTGRALPERPTTIYVSWWQSWKGPANLQGSGSDEKERVFTPPQTVTSDSRYRTMKKYNASNERIKRKYFAFLKEAKRYSEATIDATAKALARFEEYNRSFRVKSNILLQLPVITGLITLQPVRPPHHRYGSQRPIGLRIGSSSGFLIVLLAVFCCPCLLRAPSGGAAYHPSHPLPSV